MESGKYPMREKRKAESRASLIKAAQQLFSINGYEETTLDEVAEKIGVGQYVDIAMLNVMHATDDYAHWALDRVWPKPEENLVWQGLDQTRILISADLKWLWHVLSKRDGLVDPTPEGADLATKLACRKQAITAHILAFPSFSALTDRLDEINLAWGRVRAFGEESLSQPSVEARGVFVNVHDDLGHQRKTVQSPYRFSHSASGINSDARPRKRGGIISRRLLIGLVLRPGMSAP